MTTSSTNTHTTLGLIGLGRFGTTILPLLCHSHNVVVFDVAMNSPDWKAPELPKNASFAPELEVIGMPTVCYAIPIRSFKSTLAKHTEHWNSKDWPHLIMEFCSVKSLPQTALTACAPTKVSLLLTHPMFGPDSTAELGYQGRSIVVDDSACSQEHALKWKSLFTESGLLVKEMSCDTHDQLAARSQGVVHFVGRVLEKFEFSSTPIDTLGAEALQKIQQQTCNDTWELFEDLQQNNAYTIGMRRELGEALQAIYNQLIPNRIDQKTLQVGIQGGKGSFNEEAAQYYLARAGITDYCLHYLYHTEAVLEALTRGQVDRGQFAVHNSIGGMVQETVHAMSRHHFSIIEEFSIKIAHCLMRRRDTALADIRSIMTHPQVLKQCKQTLAKKYPRLSQLSGEGELLDSARVASKIANGNLPATYAAMGSKSIAEHYGLEIIEEGLQDDSENYTSFLWVERPAG
jgi:prephenate dehydrogenase